MSEWPAYLGVCNTAFCVQLQLAILYFYELLYSCKTMIVVTCDVTPIHKSMWTVLVCFLLGSLVRTMYSGAWLMILRITDRIAEVCCWFANSFESWRTQPLQFFTSMHASFLTRPPLFSTCSYPSELAMCQFLTSKLLIFQCVSHWSAAT